MKCSRRMLHDLRQKVVQYLIVAISDVDSAIEEKNLRFAACTNVKNTISDVIYYLREMTVKCWFVKKMSCSDSTLSIPHVLCSRGSLGARLGVWHRPWRTAGAFFRFQSKIPAGDRQILVCTFPSFEWNFGGTLHQNLLFSE